MSSVRPVPLGRMTASEFRRRLEGAPAKVVPARRAIRQLEDNLQITVVEWLMPFRAQGLLEFWHCPNGGARSKRAGGRLKAMGVRRGVADLTVAWPGAIAFIELKIKGGRIETEQREFKERMEGFGHLHAFCFSLEGVQRVLRGWGAPVS